MSSRYPRPLDARSQITRKVPAITAHFWAVKILTTAMGEALSHYLVHTIDPYIAVGIGGFAKRLRWALPSET